MLVGPVVPFVKHDSGYPSPPPGGGSAQPPASVDANVEYIQTSFGHLATLEALGGEPIVGVSP